MNIAYYFLGFPPFHGGGLLKYASDLALEMKKRGNEVFMIMPGAYSFIHKQSTIRFYKIVNDLNVYVIDNPLPVSFDGILYPKYYAQCRRGKNYLTFFKNNRIDILHIHSLIGLPREMLLEAKSAGVKIVFTTHDFFGICPKVYLFDSQSSICYDYNDGMKCVNCNNSPKRNYANNFLKPVLRRNLLVFDSYRINIFYQLYHFFKKYLKGLKLLDLKNMSNILSSKDYGMIIEDNKAGLDLSMHKNYKYLRMFYLSYFDYIDLILFNSEQTMKTYKQYINLHNMNSKVIPVVHSDIQDNRNLINYSVLHEGKINILFLGRTDEIKGFRYLINILDHLRKKYSNFKLSVYGIISQEIPQRDYIEYKGIYSSIDLKDIFRCASVVVIPSLCLETFGFVGLEAISFGIPLIVTENVGMKMLVEHGVTGFITPIHALSEQLENILKNPNILEKVHENIIKKDFSLTFEKHVNQIESIYEDIITPNR